MLTRSQLLAREQTLRGTKVLSVYLTGWTDDPAKRDAWRIELKNALDRERVNLQEASHTAHEDFDACVRHLWTHLGTVSGVVGAPGWVAFVTTDGVQFAEAVPVELPWRVDWGQGIQLAPYIRVLKHGVPAAVAVVDGTSARLYRYVGRQLDAAGSLQAHTRAVEPQHMGSMPRQGFHTGTRGSTGTDVAERMQRVGRDRMLHELAEQLVAEAGPDGWIMIGGIGEVVDAALHALPETEQSRARRLSLDVHATDAQIVAATERAVTEASRERDGTLVDEVTALAAAYGKGIIAWEGTLEALRQRAVDHLVFTDHFMRDHPVEVEKAVALALEQSADVTHVSGTGAEHLDAEGGGIGARLRFVPTREQAPLAASG